MNTYIALNRESKNKLKFAHYYTLGKHTGGRALIYSPMDGLLDTIEMLVLLPFYTEDWGAVLTFTWVVAQRCFLRSAATLRHFRK